MKPFVEETLTQFLDQLSSSNPTPGGGTASALSGALAASLLLMVCRLTIGKKGYESIAARLRDEIAQIEPLRAELIALMQRDSEAYARVMDAYKLPKQSDAEKSTRAHAIQTALQAATDAPLRVAELCGAILERARFIAVNGNKNAVSDCGVGALLADAGMRGAIMNVEINLGLVEDDAFATDRRAQSAELLRGADNARAEIARIVYARKK